MTQAGWKRCGTGTLVPAVPEELGEVKKLQNGEFSNVIFEATIAPPEGMTSDEYDQAVIEQCKNYPLEQLDYGMVVGPNSNTIADNVIEKTGAIMPDVPNATAQNHGEKAVEREILKYYQWIPDPPH